MARNITFSADEGLIEVAREAARADNTTGNEQFKIWLQQYARALALQGKLSFGFYDSLIVAAALEAGCRRLLSEDLQHGRRIDGLRVENPFE